ncbi:MAG: hypothetical protein ACOYX5_07930 [Actinomycetota bacterium]
MPTFKVRCSDGTEQDVQAQRVTLTPRHLRFERRADGDWIRLLELPSTEVSEVRRRVTETDGSYRWVDARPSPAEVTR